MDQGSRKKLNYLNQRKKIQKLSTKEELQDFINQSLNKKQDGNIRVNIGQTTDKAKKRIKKIYNNNVPNYIDIDKSGIIHTYEKVNHNLEPDDFLHAVEAINTTNDITMSNDKHQDSDVLEFDKDINGKIKYLTEAHPRKDYLLVFDAWRKNKANKRPNATNSPPGLTSKTNLFQASNKNIPETLPKVNEEKP